MRAALTKDRFFYKYKEDAGIQDATGFWMNHCMEEYPMKDAKAFLQELKTNPRAQEIIEDLPDDNPITATPKKNPFEDILGDY